MSSEQLSPEQMSEMSEETKTITVPEEMNGLRIDKGLSDLLKDQSRSYLKQLLKDGRIRLNGNAAKPSTRLQTGDQVSVDLPEKVVPDIEAEDIPLDILYEDDDLLVVNKPKGMVVHPAAGHYTGTLVNAVLYHCKGNLSGINGVLRPGIVHRIDKDTTGSVIVCKNDSAHQCIAEQLKEHSIRRIYYALVCGNIREDEITVNARIGRDLRDRKKMTVVKTGGKHAVTHARVLERFGDYTFIECRLETGRTHQIRVHMAYIGHPVAGDEVYGSRRRTPFPTQGQCLHAGILGFVHPTTGEYIETIAPLPTYFEDILEKLRREQL